ncbi:MAG: thiamine pyrophosphate enzyme-like TPP-binding protein [Dehalococcoidia bacterium]|nr:thiamine pyrophosphate enzyme-like TPP-binding protein [Dehalococcoidia bacterium]
MNVKGSNPRYGSDLVVDLMKAVGIEYVAFNPGSTFRGTHDSLVNYGANNPKIVLCNHEEISVAIAHGYGVAAGKPMAVITHNIVGLLHASMAIYNAWCDMSPIMVLGGGGPMEVGKWRNWVDWVHVALVQGNAVRDYVKWDDQPFDLSGLVESFLRGYRIATARPHGPVYLCLDSAMQEAPIEEPVAIPDSPGASRSTAIAPDPDVVEQVARGLVKAEMPLIMADRMGGGDEGVMALVELADLLAAPVIEMGGRFNFPNTHPLEMGGNQDELISKADMVLALEVGDLFGALQSGGRGPRSKRADFQSRLSPGARVIDVSLRDLVTRGWSSNRQRLQKVELTVLADPVLMVRQLVASCRRLLGKAASSTAREQRRRELSKTHQRNRLKWQKEAAGLSTAAPIASGWLAHELWEVIKGDDWVLAHGELRNWPRRLWDFDVPYRYVCQSGGAGLGHGMGSAIGAALANQGKGRLLVDIQPDGDLLMTPQAIWTAVQQKLPLLIVMYNNRSYFNSETHAAVVAQSRERPMENRGMAKGLSRTPPS